MARASSSRAAAIRAANEQFRKAMPHGSVVITRGIAQFSDLELGMIAEEVQAFEAFTPGNDPWEEHDFGGFEFQGQTIFWKIDAYDLDQRFASPDPTDPTVTRRVLTIMLAEEY